MRAAGIVVALALLAPAARAQAPVIDELRFNGLAVTRLVAGGVYTARGRGFHVCPPLPPQEPGSPPPRNPCRHAELEITLGDRPVLLLDCNATHATFIVPVETPPGPARLKIAMRGRGEATLDVDVQPAPRRRGDPNDPRVGQAEIEGAFTIDRFEHLRDPRGARIEVRGRAGVPDGFRMIVSLHVVQLGPLRDRREVDRLEVRIRGGAFLATFGPYGHELPLGDYRATARFELRRQPRRAARAFLDEWWPWSMDASFELIERRKRLEVRRP